MSATEDAKREQRLRHLARIAVDTVPQGTHVDEPLLALMRDGDQADDLNDALAHVAGCSDCRARLTEGNIESKQVVVMAIEAPRASQRDLEVAAEGVNARLVERGQGRWTAVVDAQKAGELKDKLEAPESSVVSRLAVGTPFEVPAPELRAARKKLESFADVPVESGTDAAEVQAWAQVAQKPAAKAGISIMWILFAVVAIGGAVALAYFLASR
jgi:hypothetical protein